MNSNEIFEKISKRNKYVLECGARRNKTYLGYLNASTQYDSLKKAFYTSINLARLDGDVPEEQLQRYEHVVKHYDKQLLTQLKDRNYNVNKISLVAYKTDDSGDDVLSDKNIEENKENDSFAERILKIENAGYSRNRYHFEFHDNKDDFEKAKQLFQNETFLALQDDLISDIDNEENSSKKLKFNFWEANVAKTTLTPPQTPNTDSKYDFNIWKKSGENGVRISELSIGICKQKLRFRVSFKSTKNNTSIGQMFNFHIVDGSGEITVKSFPSETTKFFDVIEFNQCCEMVNFNIKGESDSYPVFVGNGIFISLSSTTKIAKIDDDTIPEIPFNFVKMDEVKSLDPKSKCDLVGIIAKNWGVEVVGDGKSKLELTITDRSKECVVVSLWGKTYENFGCEGNAVIIRNGIVNEYAGVKSVNCSPNSLFWNNPDLKIATELKEWFDEEMAKLKQ